MKYFRFPIIKNEKVKDALLEIYNHVAETTKAGAVDILSVNYKGVNYMAIYRSLKRLERERYLEISKKTNKYFFKLTSKGKNLAELIKFSLGDEKWDKKWRVLIFDIPEKYRKRRDFLRRKLKELGLKQLQLSVWVTPYPLPKSFSWLLKEMNLDKYMRSLVVESVNREDELKKIFNL
jgi:DNA-binding transcriptional regulator PaaX